MSLKIFKLYLLLFLFGNINAQQVLQVLRVKPGSFKKYEIFTNEVIEYKLKGEHHYKKDVIVNMSDDRIMLQNDSMIKLSEIKALRFHRPSHLLKTINKVCFIGGVGYVSLNIINNLILDGALRVDPRALYISGGFIVAGLILKMISVKHVRIRSNTSLKIVDMTYRGL